MEYKINGNKIAQGFFWKIMENGGAQGVQFIVSVMLARMLSPKEYDVLAIMLIFTGIANVFVQNGFATALVQKKAADETDFSSVFFFNILIALFVYIILFFTAIPLAVFYNNPDILPLLRVLSVIVFFGAVISVQNAYISKHLEFRSLFIASLIASVLSGTVSIYMAGKGRGVWALVWQQIIYYISLCLILFSAISWKPTWVFDIRRLKAMFDFGWKILVSAVLDNIFTNMHGLVIGKIYDRGTLGNFTRGEQFPKIIVGNMGATIQSVLLPVMAEYQDDRERVKIILKDSVIIGSYLLFPAMAGMVAVADKLILLLLGMKWEGAIPFLRLMCLAYMFWPLHISNLQALNALGRSDIFLKLEIIKKLLSVLVLILGIRYNAMIFIAFKVLADYICVFINAFPNRRLLGYGIFRQLADIIRSLLSAFVMGTAVYIAGRFVPAGWTGLCLQILLGSALYLLLGLVSKDPGLRLLKQKLTGLRQGDSAR